MPWGVRNVVRESLDEGAEMRTLGRPVIWLLDLVMLFAFPTAKTDWGNRGLLILLLILVAVAAQAKIYTP